MKLLISIFFKSHISYDIYDIDTIDTSHKGCAPLTRNTARLPLDAVVSGYLKLISNKLITSKYNQHTQYKCL